MCERQLYQLSKELSEAIFLDNNSLDNASGYSIFSAEPLEKAQSIFSDDINDELAPLHFFNQKILSDPQKLPSHFKEQPFTYGLMCYCSYNLGEALQLKRSNTAKASSKLNTHFPDLFVGHYTWSYVYHHAEKQGYLTFSPFCSENTRLKILDIISSTSEGQRVEAKLSSLDWKKSQAFSEYTTQFEKVQQYIRNGDCYQVNLTQRFEAHSEIHAADLYFSSRKDIHMPYSCFIALNHNQHLLSFSPEQFISIDQRKIESKPIKGTIANDGKETTKQALISSKKNQAENVMIVDLLRNDLGKVCQSNSIHVPELFKLESYKNVHHLVSKICGTLRPEISELDAFLASFPGGSITGAPKIRAMQVIKELEVYSRSAYCGSVFYLNCDGKFDSNILIRTVTKDKNRLYCWAGGGIVSDSDLLEEYQESLTKVANITGINS